MKSYPTLPGSAHQISNFFFKRDHLGQTEMTLDGITMKFNSPALLKREVDDDGEEATHSLPPYAPVPAYSVEQYPGCPEQWTAGRPNRVDGVPIMRYFVPIQMPEDNRYRHGGETFVQGRGLWIDFSSMMRSDYDWAILPSMEGLNSITARKAVAPWLRQHIDKCPIHGETQLTAEGFCPDCNFKWPRQNYLSTAASRKAGAHYLWTDGFRTGDNEVRQFFFSENKSDSVAISILGDEASEGIGVMFFSSKEERPKPVYQTRSRGGFALESLSAADYEDSGLESLESFSAAPVSKGATRGGVRSLSASSGPESVEASALHVGKGAKIKQRVDPDPNDLDKYNQKPSLIVEVFPVLSTVARDIIERGRRKETADGPFAGTPTLT